MATTELTRATEPVTSGVTTASTDVPPPTTVAPPIRPPLGQGAVTTALDAVKALPLGSVGVGPGQPSVVTGSTITTVTVPLALDGLTIATDPVVVAVSSSGAVLHTTWTDDDAGWQSVRPLDDGVTVQVADVSSLVASQLQLGDMLVESSQEVWVPVRDELRSGWRLLVTDGARSQRFDVLVDSTTLTVASVTPLAAVQAADDCPEPTEIEAPAACVGGPSSDIATLDRPLTDLDDETGAKGLVGRHARVVLVPKGTAVAAFDTLTADPSDFRDSNARWGGAVDDPWFAAANAYFWITSTATVLDGMGFKSLVSDPVPVGISLDPVAGVAHVRPDNRVFFGTTSHGHSAADAQVVVHELAHWLLRRSAPMLSSSLWPESVAFNEADADVTSFLMTATLDLDDPACFSEYLGQHLEPSRSCLRRLDATVTYPKDVRSTTDPYAAGSVWSSAVYHAFDTLVSKAGGTVDECLDTNACGDIARRLLHTLVESWPLLNSDSITLADAAQALLTANEQLGLLDGEVLRQALADRNLLDPVVSHPTVTVTLQHPHPEALEVAVDVLDAAGTVICSIAGVPAAPITAVDATPCAANLPASSDQVWRTTIQPSQPTDPGEVVEVAITLADGSSIIATTTDGTIIGTVDAQTVVTIPEGANGDLRGSWRLDGVQLLSGIGIDDDSNRVVAVVAGAFSNPLLTGFDAATGSVVWRQTFSYGNSYPGIPAGFVMRDGQAIAVTVEDGRTGLAAYAIADGAERWFTPVDQPFTVSSCGTAVCVAAGANGTRQRFDVATGSSLGPIGDVGADELPMASIDDDLVSMTEGSTPQLRRWNPDNGATTWTTTPGAEIGANTSGGWHTEYRPDLGEYIVSIGPTSDILSGTDGYTAAIDPQNGQVRWIRKNAWLPSGFPDSGPLYVITYEPGFGLGGHARGTAVERLDAATGRTLATATPTADDPLRLTYLFALNGTSMWWRSGESAIDGGRDMASDTALELPPSGVAWEIRPRDAITIDGKDRTVPEGARAIDLASDRTLVTRQQPPWIGVHGQHWSAYVTDTGGVAAVPT